jgi:predicted DNA-binding antitoxin AbrB/MazE fold protein
MPLTIEAIDENGALKAAQRLPLKEQERVQITGHTAGNWASETGGMILWTCDRERLCRPEDAESDPREQA